MLDQNDVGLVGLLWFDQKTSSDQHRGPPLPLPHLLLLAASNTLRSLTVRVTPVFL